MVSVSVDIDAEEVLEEIDDSTLREEVERREQNAVTASRPTTERALLEQTWLHFRNRPDEAPACLREYIWRVLGKAL